MVVTVMRFFIVDVQDECVEAFLKVCKEEPFACMVNEAITKSEGYKRYQLIVDQKDLKPLIDSLETQAEPNGHIIFAEVVTGWDTCYLL